MVHEYSGGNEDNTVAFLKYLRSLFADSTSVKLLFKLEVTHEALFANWNQMREWLESSRSDIRFQRRLDEAALSWDKNCRPEGSLWPTPDLDFLKKYNERASDNMAPLQLEFFEASVAA